MTAARSKVPAIGSAQWILEERHQSNDLVAQELEDFGFSVRNELEWLNEHMAEIFSTNAVYVFLNTRLTRLFADASQKLCRRIQNAW